jgi:hypothetical protein
MPSLTGGDADSMADGLQQVDNTFSTGSFAFSGAGNSNANTEFDNARSPGVMGGFDTGGNLMSLVLVGSLAIAGLLLLRGRK